MKLIKKGKMELINKVIYVILILSVSGCNSLQEKIEKYIDGNNSKFNDDSLMVINMKDVLCDYDRLYIVGSLIPLSCVVDMINVPLYRKGKNESNALFGYDSDAYYLILVKDGEVVYEEELKNENTKVSFNLESFSTIKGVGTFDNVEITAEGYYTDSSNLVILKINGCYFVCDKRYMN